MLGPDSPQYGLTSGAPLKQRKAHNMSSSLINRLRAEIARLEYRMADERRRRIPDNLALSELKRRWFSLRVQLSDRESAVFDRWRLTPAPIWRRPER